MLGPKFPGVESSNAYGPQAAAAAVRVEGQRVMAAPHYRGIDIQHRFGGDNNNRALIYFFNFQVSTIVSVCRKRKKNLFY